MEFKPLKRNKHIKFIIDCGYDFMAKEFEINNARRVGGFIEALLPDGRKTFIVDINLSNGIWRGTTLWEMSADLNGVNTLKWMLDRDFPEEIRNTILKHFEDRGYDEDNNGPKRDEESLNEFLDSMNGFVDSPGVKTFEFGGGRKSGRRALFNHNAGRSSWL